VKVRRAYERDLPAIRQIAAVAWRTSYADLLGPGTIERWLDTTYSPSALEQRWQDHPIFLVEIDGLIIAFADVYVEGATIVLAALCTHPEYRRQGAGRVLLEKARSLAPTLPLSVDLILGNQSGERFVERLGFSPGETIDVHLYGEPFLEQRWWMESALIS
jgi:GNAT superfamily N-acetyltransferase